MKEWQKERNYRRVRDKDKKVIANIITIDGVDVEVTEEVFQVYSKMDRRERYLEKERSKGKELSLDQMQEKGGLPGYVGNEDVSCVEDIVLQNEEQAELTVHKQLLENILSLLSEEEKQLIQALFFDGISTREYAKQIGVYQRAVIYRRDKLLEKLRKSFFEKF